MDTTEKKPANDKPRKYPFVEAVLELRKQMEKQTKAIEDIQRELNQIKKIIDKHA